MDEGARAVAMVRGRHGEGDQPRARCLNGAQLCESLLHELEGVRAHGRLDAAQLAHLVRARLRFGVEVGAKVRIRVRFRDRVRARVGAGVEVTLIRRDAAQQAHYCTQPQQHRRRATLVREQPAVCPRQQHLLGVGVGVGAGAGAGAGVGVGVGVRVGFGFG